MGKPQPILSSLEAKDYKSTVKPIWCPGCGHFGIESALFRALAHLGLPPEQVAVISGIGCSSRLPAYTECYGFHGIHGRALPMATGLKLARPDLTVVVASGDGDAFSIGGNHFIHACRRNVDMTCIVMDNEVYGMTKGQPSPTTPPNWDCKIAPGGTGVSPFSPLMVALASGAGFIARGFSGDRNGIAKMLVEAIRYPGFALLQVLSPCVTFRPEEKDWRLQVHPSELPTTANWAEATRRLAADDGMTTGIFYKAELPLYPATVMEPIDQLNAIETELTL
ncbi:MAG TPA: 2-oxoacid:ferredoxin oxidoreductase subunit beta [Candidatus Competibacteraceae bacterium]|nr:2-oxoacid:ferredoxin oxidoreductase subunit beta [Candidatus Competibacteraceae bacterium]HQA24621.1 2-oxoacid:ferredoxin oxidoreductase subunit beta [Candidatus Competibacteraceae bacterium]